MQGARSRTVRNQSRSPVPPTPTMSTPRPFLPPSHYAAAGGFNSRSPVSQLVHNGGDSSKHRRNEDKTRKHSKIFAEPSSSDSSITSAVDEPLQRPQRSNAQHIRSGFPELEAQLLPTLRDTIDRMTLTPRNSTHFKPIEIPAPEQRNRSKSRHDDLELEPRPAGRPLTAIEPKKINLRQTSAMNEEPLTPNHFTPTMRTPRSKATPKSALKSVLRSPMPTPDSPKSQKHVVTSPAVAGTSLRNMKSLLTRKCSGSLKSPFNGTKTRKEARNAEVHDELQAGFETEPPSVKSPLRKNFQSHIPRPQARYYNDDPNRLEGSDLERRYEASMRERRKLTVTNAEVSVSGTSSGSDVDSRDELHMGNDADTGRKTNQGRSRSPIGLGLSLPHVMSTRQNDQQYWTSLNTRRQEDRPSPQEKTLRFSLPVSESAGSFYSDEFNPCQSNSTSNPIRSNYHRTTPGLADITKSPLASLVKSNTYGGPMSSRKGRFPSPSSRSPTLSVSTKEEITDDESLSEREGYSFHRSKVKDARRRSSSCEPRLSASFKLSEDDAIPIEPRRPRSACQSRKPSPRTSRIFPENLRELIKSRNSLSKLPPASKQKGPQLPAVTASSRYPSSDPRSRADEYRKPQKSPAGPYTSSTPRSRREDSGRDQYARDQSEASAIAYSYRSAAARERLAFGIPPSQSDELGSAESDQLSHAESDMSSLNQTMCQVDSEDLSVDAESIFKALDYSRNQDRKKQQRLFENTPQLSIISPTISASSTYDTRGAESRSPGRKKQADPPRDFGQPRMKDVPKSREGVIQEIFETEEELLRLCHVCMRMFILPLRVQDSRSWIAGVPPNIAKLLDWFDDIVKLHEEIYQSLCSARDTMSPATDRVSESLRCFVLKVEVYQPYLVRLADVSTEIASLLETRDTDFAQFVSIQQRSRECEGWSLERMLMLPVNRLAAYQDLFTRMLDLTPKTHQDYLSTFSLSRSTDMVIRIMTEVKIREDEYNLLKAFSSRIQGLVAPGNLATRERRLLHSGPLALVISDSKTLSRSNLKSQGRQPGDTSRSSRGSRLLDVIGASSSTIFEKSHLMKSTSTDDSFSSGVPITSTPVKSSSWLSRLPLGKRSRSKSPLPSVQTSAGRDEPQYSPPTAPRSVSVHAFIFNDLVLLAQPSQTLGDDPNWILSKDLATFRPLSIAGFENRSTGETTVSLEVMVLDPEHFNEAMELRLSSFRNVDLVISPSLPGTSDDSVGLGQSDALHQVWLIAFRQCSQTTLRKFTFPGLPHQDDCMNGSDRMLDTRLAISSLVGSGLPIPRSPSGTFPDMYENGSGTFGGDEREERGWWSLRYQQIFREFQRQDSLLFDDDSLAI